MGAVEKAVGIAIAAIMASVIAPIAVMQFINTSTTGWGDAESGLWDLMPVFVILAFVIMIAGYITSRGD